MRRHALETAMQNNKIHKKDGTLRVFQLISWHDYRKILKREKLYKYKSLKGMQAEGGWKEVENGFRWGY